MILPDRKDAVQKAWMYRVLSAIYDNALLAALLCFKGGTCAAMRGFLNRFSVDLDFDFLGKADELSTAGSLFEGIFSDLGLTVKTKSHLVPQYFLKYPDQPPNSRNTLKIDVTTNPPGANQYEPVRLLEIDRIVTCHTPETMFANKLVAMVERYEVHGLIAGRDLYDIHHFFLQGLRYDAEVIKERRKGIPVHTFFEELADFITAHITRTTLDQDLNMLISPDTFKAIRNTLKEETLMFLGDEIRRLSKK